jgi:hypothetical protein
MGVKLKGWMFKNRALSKIFGLNRDEIGEKRTCLSLIYTHQIFQGDQMDKDEVSGECSMHDGDEKFAQIFSLKTRTKETTWHRRIILNRY